jgi:hypothetical protein
MTDFAASGLTARQRAQLAEEEMWQNPDDDWLDYNSAEDEEDDEENKEDSGDINFEPDPLYNDKQDDRDQKWVDENLAKYMEKGRRSDATLNCPFCFTLLCMDCQRHDIYLTQYRAMFVRNCKVVKDKEIRYRKQAPELSKKQQKKLQFKEAMKAKKLSKKNNATNTTDTSNMSIETPSTQSQQQQENVNIPKPFEFTDNILVEDEHLFEPEIYYPVHCAICDVQVAVMDTDEVYHFFNVVPSD